MGALGYDLADRHTERCFYQQVGGIVIVRNVRAERDVVFKLAQEDFDDFRDKNPHFEFLPEPQSDDDAS